MACSSTREERSVPELEGPGGGDVAERSLPLSGQADESDSCGRGVEELDEGLGALGGLDRLCEALGEVRLDDEAAWAVEGAERVPKTCQLS